MSLLCIRPEHSHNECARFTVQSSPNDQLAFSNCLIVNPADFPQGMHVLVKQQFPCTTRCACLSAFHLLCVLITHQP